MYSKRGQTNDTREFMKNWRPISLLCTDYKIISNVMANRMKTVLNDKIGPDQKGFLKEGYIEEYTRLVYDLIQYCKEKNKVGILLLVDFEKAFDSIEWTYIRKLLKKYNFGPDIIFFLYVIYKEAESCMIVSPVRSTYGGYYGLVVVTPRPCPPPRPRPRPQTLHRSHDNLKKSFSDCFHIIYVD